MIRKILGYAAVIAVLGFAAQAEQTGGTVASFDAATRTVILNDGKSYILAEGLDAAKVAPGTKVVFNYEMDGNRMVVNEIATQ